MISPESKPQVSDRVFILQPMEGKKPTSNGVIDPRLFSKGEDANRLHAVMDPETCLWSFHYEKGAIPGALRGNYTGFRAAKKHAENFFTMRNIEITDIIYA